MGKFPEFVRPFSCHEGKVTFKNKEVGHHGYIPGTATAKAVVEMHGVKFIAIGSTPEECAETLERSYSNFRKDVDD